MPLPDVEKRGKQRTAFEVKLSKVDNDPWCLNLSEETAEKSSSKKGGGGKTQTVSDITTKSWGGERGKNKGKKIGGQVYWKCAPVGTLRPPGWGERKTWKFERARGIADNEIGRCKGGKQKKTPLFRTSGMWEKNLPDAPTGYYVLFEELL